MNISCAFAALLMGVNVIASPASAASMQVLNSVARGSVVSIGKGVGTDMCGTACGRGLGVAAGGVYDASQNFTRRASPVLQNIGRNLRESVIRR